LQPIKVGVAGIGFIGLVHMEALWRLNDIEVVAVCDTEDVIKAKAPGLEKKLRRYSDFGKMLAENDLDCVHICTPNISHYPLAKAALLAGVHVVCEKPLAVSKEEARELLELAKARGLIHSTNYNIRYYPLMHHLRAMIKNGDMGEIRAVTGVYLQDWLFYETDYNWRLNDTESGASEAVADIGSHWIDLMEFTTGRRITEVMADFAITYKTRKRPKVSAGEVETFTGKMLTPSDYEDAYEDVPIVLEDYANVMFRLDNGGKGFMNVSQGFAGKKNSIRIDVSGSKRSVIWDSERPDDMWIGKRDGANELLKRDPSLVYPEAAALIDCPGGHAESFADTFKQLYKKSICPDKKTPMPL
jgi:predicted dehydrogenase